MSWLCGVCLSASLVEKGVSGPQSIRWALNKVPELQEIQPFPHLQGPGGHTARSSQSQGPSNPLEEMLSWLENPEVNQKHGGWRVLWGRTEKMESINWAAAQGGSSGMTRLLSSRATPTEPELIPTLLPTGCQ